MAELRSAYLVLGENDTPTKRSVRFSHTVSDALLTWRALTRISPIFPLLSRNPDPLIPSTDDTYWLIFVGPINPHDLLDWVPSQANIWLTLGAFNALVTCDQPTVELLLPALNDAEVRFEAWSIQKGILVQVEISSARSASAQMWRDDLREVASSPVAGELRELVNEYCPLMASSLARAERVIPEIYSDLSAINEFVRETLAVNEGSGIDAEEHNHERLALLTTLNAGLSRFSSQAFSGISPIEATESHFWSHSLLGTGMANIGLLRYASFLVRLLGQARIPQRLERLANDPCTIPLEAVSPDDDWWYTSQLDSVHLTAAEQAEPILPLVTYFSGRDGFKSTPHTLSAPLAVIPSCNSLRWTLQTLTHEISHSLVRGAFAVIYPDSEDAAEMSASMSLLKNREPNSHLEALRRYMLLTICSMDSIEEDPQQTSGDTTINTTLLRSILDRWHDVVEELMVHVFDFLLFYRGHPENYIRAIWLSWSVIPNISNRVPEYVLRTLSAILSLNLRRGEKAEAVTKTQVLRILKKLRNEPNAGIYIRQAVAFIESAWETELKPKLSVRRGLVRLVRAYLYSDNLESALYGERRIASRARRRGGYKFKVGEISSVRIDNPHRFIEQYTSGAHPSADVSMWMWMILAFNVSCDAYQTG